MANMILKKRRHIGDFCCKGKDRGVKGTMTKAETWEEIIKPQVIHIKGNHDPNNSVKNALDCAVITFSGISWYMIHIPPSSIGEIPESCGAVLCGHVHEKWRHIFVGEKPVINVGADVWNYRPISKMEIYEYYQIMPKGRCRGEYV